jgi:hypothetical protein
MLVLDRYTCPAPWWKVEKGNRRGGENEGEQGDELERRKSNRSENKRKNNNEKKQNVEQRRRRREV